MTLLNGIQYTEKGGKTLDYSALRGKIYEVFGSVKRFAEAMELSYVTILKKLAGANFWTQGEILKAADLLGIKRKDIIKYFFTPNVE